MRIVHVVSWGPMAGPPLPQFQPRVGYTERVVPHLAGSYLVVETTNTCSLKCVHCSVSEVGHPHHARTGFLPLATAERLFADLRAVRARFDTLIPFWLGEPLLHPEFGPFYATALRAASEGGCFGRIEVHTNATHLGPDRVRVALNGNPVPQTWHLTLDATTRATYRAVKGVDRFDAVEANVAAFVRAKADTRARWPRLVFQFIVSERNAAEVPGFRERWERACRSAGLPVRTVAQEVPPGEEAVVFFRQLDAPTPGEQAAANEVFRVAMRDAGIPLPRPTQSPVAVGATNTAVCGCFWKSPVVGWDGSVTTCTRDNRLENRLGSLHEQSFAELWWGPAMNARRAAVARADYRGLRPCQECFIPRSANYSAVTVDEIAAHG